MALAKLDGEALMALMKEKKRQQTKASFKLFKDATASTTRTMLAGEETPATSMLAEAKKGLEMVEHKLALAELLTHMRVPADTVTAATLVKPKGLSAGFCRERMMNEGMHSITPPPPEPKWKQFMKELFSCCRQDEEAELMEYYANGGGFKGMMPPLVVTIRDGQMLEINVRDLVRGDIVRVKDGDKIPADIRVLICSKNCQVDNASLTGESGAEPCDLTDQFTDENPLETKNLAFWDTLLVQGSLTGIVVSTGDQTVKGRIAFLDYMDKK
jgi:hypothetical protein